MSVPSPWTDQEQATLVRLAADGETAKVIAAMLGKTRSAVLGRAYRTGVKLPMTEAKGSRGGPPIGRGPGRSWTLPPGHPCRKKGRPRHARCFSDQAISAALAARLAGASRVKAAALAGSSWQAVRIWERKPELMALGQALFDRAKASAGTQKAAREAQERDRLAAIAAHNAPILQILDCTEPRTASLAREFIAGASAATLGNAHGITRERAAQILARAMGFGIDFDGRLKRAPREVRRKAWADPQVVAAKRAAAVALEKLGRRGYA